MILYKNILTFFNAQKIYICIGMLDNNILIRNDMHGYRVVFIIFNFFISFINIMYTVSIALAFVHNSQNHQKKNILKRTVIIESGIGPFLIFF